jgi:hypothetical protein
VGSLAKIRNMYPGANTCYGFYSFYDYIVPHDANNKIVLKGGPGVGKSTFMKNIGKDLSEAGIDVEYHWCSSDNDSLDGVVAGNRQLCLVDGTAPHVVDPRYPGAVDWIINMGDFWDADKIKSNKTTVIRLTKQIGLNFERAYNRLKEAHCAWWEWCSYYRDTMDTAAINRNILALTDDFLHNSPKTGQAARHLFAAAITPLGVVNKVDSLIDDKWGIFAVKGSPGSGIKGLFKHIEEMARLNGIYTEVYHCPFDPANIDLIIVPENKLAILDISGHVVNYTDRLSAQKYKRILDFDQFQYSAAVNPYENKLISAKERFKNGVQDAITFIKTAKSLHDELEINYVPAMDFARVEEFRKELVEKLLVELKQPQD